MTYRDSSDSRTGSILPMAMISLAVLAMVAAAALYRVQPRVASTYHSASWNDALNSAEAGADMALKALNNSTANPTTAWAAWTPSDATTFPKIWVPTIAPHTGDGNNKVWCKVTVDNAIVDVNGAAWMRVRSTGVAELPAASRNGIEGALLDVNGVKNFRAVLRRERFVGDLTLGALRLPQVARTIEAIAAPPGARLYARAVTARNAVTLNGAAYADSFDSSDPHKSTSSLYDPAKRQSHGSIASNSSGGSSNAHGCVVWGDASSNGGVIQNTAGVTGEIYNNFETQLPDIAQPAWASFNITPTAITNPGAPTTLVGGTAGTPQLYRLSDLTVSDSANPLILAPHAIGQQSYMKIWVTGRTTVSGTGYIQQQPGVHVQIIAEDDIAVGGGGFMNQTNLAANLEILGVTPASGSRNATFSGTADFIGILNAPAFDMIQSGSGKFVGAAIGRSATLNSSGGFHYDEDLVNFTYEGSAEYQFTSWIEDLH